MPYFTVRVELHGAQSEHYERLHEAMQKGGFSRTITSDAGTTYNLPWAEYDYTSTGSPQSVGEKAKAIANTIISNGVFVTQSAGRWWKGLDVVSTK